MREDIESEMQRRVARLVGLKRHERPSPEHYVSLSRAVRFRLEQERLAGGSLAWERAGGTWGARWFRQALREGASRWLEPSTWVPTLLAALALAAWLLDGSSHVPPFHAVAPQTAGLGGLPEPVLLGERPKAPPLVGVHVRIIFLDSDQIPPGFIAFPPLPPQLLEPAP